MAKPQREAQNQVSREEVKQLAIAIGVREAARKLGLNEDRVRQWSSRGKWFITEPKPQPPTVTTNHVTTVTKPSDALRDSLADDSKATKIALSKAARQGSEHLAKANPGAIVKQSRAFKDLVSGSSELHGWNAESKGSGVMPGLQVYSEQTVIQVGQ